MRDGWQDDLEVVEIESGSVAGASLQILRAPALKRCCTTGVQGSAVVSIHCTPRLWAVVFRFGVAITAPALSSRAQGSNGRLALARAELRSWRPTTTDRHPPRGHRRWRPKQSVTAAHGLDALPPDLLQAFGIGGHRIGIGRHDGQALWLSASARSTPGRSARPCR
jgi:hypothetical protein